MLFKSVPTGDIEATRFGIELAVRRIVGGESPLVVADLFGIMSVGIVVGGCVLIGSIKVDDVFVVVVGAARIT